MKHIAEHTLFLVSLVFVSKGENKPKFLVYFTVLCDVLLKNTEGYQLVWNHKIIFRQALLDEKVEISQLTALEREQRCVSKR